MENEKKKKKVTSENKFPINGIKWVPYIAGWIFGVFNLVFWIIIAIVGVLSKNKHKFIDEDIHTVVMIWGIFVLILITLALAIIFTLIAFGFVMFLVNLI